MKRILALHLHGLGNALMFTPALLEMHRTFPEARFTIISGLGASAQVFERYPFVEEIISLHSTDVRPRLVSRIRGRAFDLAFASAQIGGLVSPLLAFLSGAPLRVGMSNARLGFLYNRRRPIAFETHFVEREYELLSLLGIGAQAQKPRIAIEERDRKAVEDFLKQESKDEDDDGNEYLVGVHTAAHWIPSKRWSIERTVALGHALSRYYGLRVVLLGGPSDARYVREIEERLDDRAINVAGRITDFYHLAALIERCRLVISNDSAPAHVAAAVGTPVVALFGPTEPATCRPYTDPDKCIVVRTIVDCTPCYPGRLTCETGECMERITLEEVLPAVEGFI